jgi:hypothetical protein
MNTINKIALSLVALFACVTAQAQTALTSTTLSAAVADARVGTVAVTSATSFTVGNLMYVDKEAMRITAVNGTLISVVRGTNQTPSTLHASLANVLTGSPSAFTSATTSMSGTCTGAATYAPTIDVRSGDMYYCLTTTTASVSVWQKNPYTSFGAAQVTAAVASAAGAVTPTGGLFHMTGSLAITSFSLPSGFVSGGFCVIPDAAYTTTATNNIALATTGVISKLQCWKYDFVTAKFYPTY